MTRFTVVRGCDLLGRLDHLAPSTGVMHVLLWADQALMDGWMDAPEEVVLNNNIYIYH